MHQRAQDDAVYSGCACSSCPLLCPVICRAMANLHRTCMSFVRRKINASLPFVSMQMASAQACALGHPPNPMALPQSVALCAVRVKLSESLRIGCTRCPQTQRLRPRLVDAFNYQACRDPGMNSLPMLHTSQCSPGAPLTTLNLSLHVHHSDSLLRVLNLFSALVLRLHLSQHGHLLPLLWALLKPAAVAEPAAGPHALLHAM